MTLTLPANQDKHRKSRFSRALPIVLLPLGGVALSLAFPNEIVPGVAGDHPPFVLGWLALLPLAWGVSALPPKTARWAVWLYGLAFYLGTLSWVRLFGYLPWLLLALYLSLTPLLALLAAQRISARPALMPLAFALVWSGLEWLRGHGIFGLAWSEVGMSQVDGPFAWLAALGGVPLITFLMLWVTGAVMRHALRKDAPRWPAPVGLAALCLCLLAGWWQVERSLSRWRTSDAAQRVTVAQSSTKRGLTPDALVNVITPEMRDREVAALLALSRNAVKPDDPADPAGHIPRLVIWSESALMEPPSYRPELRDFCAKTGSYLLAGGPYYRMQPQPPYVLVENSAYLLGPTGAELDRYAKIHLVPFGEFVPLRPLVARFYTVRANDLSPGEERRLLRAGGHPFGVGICFESTLADSARAYADQGARLLVYITNDAWFHETSAVRQHFNHARFRAIETGLPVARAASTGISGFIAPDGRILDEIGTNRVGAKSRRIADGIPGTAYTAAGYLFGPLCLLAGVALLLLPRRSSS